ASQLLAALANSALSAVVVAAVGLLAYGVPFPKNLLQMVVAFGLGTSALAAIGLMMGSFLSTTRSAQGLGLVLFFVMWPLSGLGPSLDTMTTAMRTVADLLPMRYVVALCQDGWLGLGWDRAFYGV